MSSPNREIRYASLYCSGINGNATSIMNMTGYRGIQFGEPKGSIKTVTGGNGSSANLDDADCTLYEGARLVVLTGSVLDDNLKVLSTSTAHAYGNQLVLSKNKETVATMGINPTDIIFMIRCFNNDGVDTGYSITNNGDEASETTYYLTVEKLDKVIR